MEFEFSVLDLVLSLREFIYEAQEGDTKNLRFVREPGLSSINLIESTFNEDQDPGIEAETTTRVISEDYLNEDFEVVILDAIKDAFDIPVTDPDSDGLGDLQTEELFTKIVASGLCLISTCPYYEMLLQISIEGDGFVATISVSKTSYNKEIEVQYNTVLFQFVYPLVTIEI